MKRLKSNKGFTLLELLCALSILSMVCLTTVMAMDVGIKNYVRNMTNSQAQILCSALTTKISDELRYAEVGTGTDIIKNPSFVGTESTYKSEKVNGTMTRVVQPITYSVGSNGRLTLAQKSDSTEVYLGQGVYSSGLYKIRVASLDAAAEDPNKFWITYNPSTKIFTVNLVITAWDSTEPLITNQFQVKTLN